MLCSAMPVLFGGYWLPSFFALAYTWVLKHWHDVMLADRVKGLDPFKATSVVPSMTASAVYLTIVLVTRQALKNRIGYDCKKYMSIYNLYQEVAGYGQAKGMTFWGNVYDPRVTGFKVGFIIWVHYNNKFVELLDTAWMLLRKKDKQLGVPCPWKKYLTMMQMMQFCICIAQSVYVLVKGNAPIGLPLAQAFVMVNMLVLFSQFYQKSYGSKRPNGSIGHSGSNGHTGSNGKNGSGKHE